MLNKTVTITIAELNSGSVIEKDVKISETSYGMTGEDYDVDLYPCEMRIYNTSGRDIEYLILEDTEEEAKYTANPSAFGFVSLLSGKDLIDPRIPYSYKILVKGLAGTATANLRIDFLNFKTKKYL